MPRCWPESARMWEQPARRKASESSESRSSRTPRIRASRSGAPSPPTRRRERAIRSMTAARKRDQGRAKPRSESSEAPGKKITPGPLSSGTGRPEIRTRVPALKARAPRRTITAHAPSAVARAPSSEPAAVSATVNRRPPDRRGTESPRVVPSTQATQSKGSPKLGAEAASSSPRVTRKASRSAADAAPIRERSPLFPCGREIARAARTKAAANSGKNGLCSAPKTSGRYRQTANTAAHASSAENLGFSTGRLPTRYSPGACAP